MSVLLERTNRDRHGVLAVGLAAIAMLAPIVGQMALARDFFGVSIEGMEDISEVQSPLDMLRQPDSFNFVSSLYTYLLFVAPLTALACAWKIWHEREASRSLFWIASLAGIVLLCMQLRLQYFGSFALYLPLLVLLDDWVRTRVSKAPYVWSASAIVIAVSLYPAFKGKLFESQAVAGDPYYAVTRPLYEPFAEACHRHSGVVLAEPDDGHYIRFHTDCSVIANNFLVTARQAERTREERKLLELPVREALERAPYVSYIFVRSAALFYVETDGSLRFYPNGVEGMQEHALVRELLGADAQRLPDHLRLIYELKANASSRPYARLFSVEH